MQRQGTFDAFFSDTVSVDAPAITGRIDRITWPSGLTPPLLGFVQPDVPFDDQTALPLTALLGEQIRVRLHSNQHCTSCGAEAGRSVCYDCAGEPPFTPCMKQPASKCTYADCPFPDYKARSCAHEFVVYLVAAGGVKVGITKRTRTLGRWQEQGASHALPIATVPNRKAAGIIERAVSGIDGIGQRLQHEWYVPMADAVDRLVDAALAAREVFPERLEACYRWSDMVDRDEIRRDVVSVPCLETPELDHRLATRHGDLQPGNAREGRVVGARGSLIATDEFVIKTRRYAGHGVTIETEAPFVESLDVDEVPPSRANVPRETDPPVRADGSGDETRSESTDRAHPIEKFL